MSVRKRLPGTSSPSRKTTVVFSAILVVIGSATAYAAIVLHSRVIPIVLGIFGYTYGSLLGIFLLGLLTTTRGSDFGNYLAMIAGAAIVFVITGVPNQLLESCGLPRIAALDSVPIVSFPWRIMF